MRQLWKYDILYYQLSFDGKRNEKYIYNLKGTNGLIFLYFIMHVRVPN